MLNAFYISSVRVHEVDNSGGKSGSFMFSELVYSSDHCNDKTMIY